jgi:hypothetical protein
MVLSDKGWTEELPDTHRAEANDADETVERFEDSKFLSL